MSEPTIYTRKSNRYPTSMLVRIDGDTTMHLSRGNVSAGGFCFEGAKELACGTRVEVLFRVPGAGLWMSGQGVILGCVQGESVIGIRGRFTEFDLGDPQILTNWIDAIRRLHELGLPSDEPGEVTLFSTTVG